MRAVRRAAVVASLLPLLAGCTGGPLSALDPAGPASASIARVWWVMAAGSSVILMGMVLLGAWAYLRRTKPSPPRYGMIAAGGVAFPSSVIVALLAYGLPAGQAMRPDPAEDAFRVNVTAHQWWWEVAYPDAPQGPLYAANEIHIPAGRPVHVSITSADVIHSFWSPRLGGKLDAIPGRTNVARLLADEPGVYRGTCAEFCGTQHARMGLRVVAHEPEALDRRLQALARSGEPARADPEAVRAYGRNCLSCHSLDPRRPGQDGPNLADLRLRATLGAGALAADVQGLRHWLQAHQLVKPGNRMPVSELDPDMLRRIAAYLWEQP